MKVTIEYDKEFGVVDLIEEFIKKSEFTHLECGTCLCKGDGIWIDPTVVWCASEVCERIYEIGDAKFVKREVKE